MALTNTVKAKQLPVSVYVSFSTTALTESTSCLSNWTRLIPVFVPELKKLASQWWLVSRPHPPPVSSCCDSAAGAMVAVCSSYSKAIINLIEAKSRERRWATIAKLISYLGPGRASAFS